MTFDHIRLVVLTLVVLMLDGYAAPVMIMSGHCGEAILGVMLFISIAIVGWIGGKDIYKNLKRT